MHAIRFLSRWLDIASIVRHRARVIALERAAQALLAGRKLALTHLGRNRPGAAHVNHHIKAMDACWATRTCCTRNEMPSIAPSRERSWSRSARTAIFTE